jgi:UDP-N-acetylmuramoylalanine--D-glutamate ligase
MQNYKQQFKGKKITVMGLGLLGGALNDIIFLIKNGAKVTVTDLKSSIALKTSVEKIKNYELARRQGRLKIKNKNKVKFVLGEHRIEDFQNANMIIEPGNVPKDGLYLMEAKKNNIPIYVSESLFVKYLPKHVKIIGVTGTRGKSMTVALIYHILNKNIKNCRVFLGGNVRGVSTLALLDQVKKGDIVVMELDSWALHGMGEIKKSPNISVFTSFMPDHMNYYGSNSLTTSKAMKKYFDDKANIFKYQKENDILIIRPGMKEFIKKSDAKGKFIVVNSKDIIDWKFNVLGSHQRENLACAVEVAKQLNIPISKIKKSVADFKGLEGRMQLLRVYKGIKIYNDNNATTPEATIAGLKAVSNIVKSDLTISGSPTSRNSRNVVLICGGTDKNLPLENLTKAINLNCKFVSFLPGSGTEKLVSSKKVLVTSKIAKDLKEAVENSLGLASRGDVILFSPAFASFGMFNNEYERNDLFIKIIKNLK